MVINRGAHYIIGGSFLSKLAAFLGSVAVVRLLDKTDFGILTSLENIYAYAYVLAGYGLNNALIRYMVLEEEEGRKKGLLLHILSRGTLFNILLVGGALFVGTLVLPQKGPIVTLLLFITLLALPFQFIYDSAQSSLRALFKNRQYATLALICVVSIWAIKVGGSWLAGLNGAVASGVIAYFALSMISISIIIKRYFGHARTEAPRKSLRSEMRKYSIQYMITNGLWVIFAQNDILLINVLTADSLAVANYKVAFAIPATLAIFSSSIGVFVAPYFVKHEDDRQWVWRNFKRVILASVLAMGAMTLLLYAVAPSVIVIVYGPQYSDAAGLMRILLIAAFVNNAIRFTVANLLASMGRIQVNLIVSALGMATQIALDLALIPVWGASGAALASVVVYAVMAAAVSVYFVSKYRLPR